MVPTRLSRRLALQILGLTALGGGAGCLSQSQNQSPAGGENTSSTTTTTATSTTTSTPTVTSVAPKLSVSDWEVTLDGKPGSPAYADGRVFVGTDTGELYALDAATGEQVWAHSFEQDIQNGPVVADGTVYYATGTYGLGGTPTAMGIPVDGGDPWEFPIETPAGSRTSLVIIGATRDGVYLGTRGDVSEDGGESVYALAPDGSKRWTDGTGDIRAGTVGPSGVYVTTKGQLDAFKTDGGKRWSFEAARPMAPALDGEQMYVNAGDPSGSQFLQAFDASTGYRVWRFNRWRAHSTAAIDGAVYAGGDTFARLDPATGETVWTAKRDHWVGRGVAPVAANRVHVGGSSVAAYTTDDGTRLWSDSEADFQRVVGVTDEMVLVSGREQPLRTLAGKTGDEQWRYDGETRLPAIGNGRAFVSTSDSLFAVSLSEDG